MERILTPIGIALAAVVLALTPIPAQASQADTRPCVSKAEFYAVNGFDPQDRANIERRWDVVGRGTRERQYEAPRTYVVVYGACGYDIRDGQILVRYRKGDNVALLAQRWIRHGAEPTAPVRPTS